MTAVRGLVLVTLLLLAGPSLALIETYEFSDPALEQRYRELSTELRCPKCQNQNIADSDAPIAQDLRKQLHRQLEEGASNEEILDYMVARYGEFVRYRPRFAGATVILWLSPLLLLLAAGLVLLLTLRSRAAAKSTGALTSAEQARVATLLDKTENDE